jgi:hypothetical protein
VKDAAQFMNNTFSNWLKKIIPRRNRAAPSPLARRIARVFQIIFLLAFCWFALWRVLLYRDVNKQFARIRAAGYPVSGAELNAWRQPVPDKENGALVMTQAFALLRTFPDARSNEVDRIQLTRTNEWSASTRELVEAYVQTNAPALAKVREALLLPRFRYPADFSYGPETELPHLSKLRELARIAALGAALDAKEGSADDWPQAVEFQLKLAGTLNDEPASISYLVRNAIIRMAVKAAERSLNRVGPGDEACRQLQAAFSRAGGTNLLPLALVGDRAQMIPLFRISWKEMQHDTQNEESGSQPAKPQRHLGKPMTILWLTGFFERDLNFYLQTMDKSISLAGLPPPASLTLSNYLDSATAVAQGKFYILSGISLSTLSRLAMREATTEAFIKLAATALAVERFRRDRGRLPAGLKELAPQFLDAVPTDPFDGAPLRYRLLARGYIIYSVDADGHDDGGREPPEHRTSADQTSYDLTFIVEH